MDKQVLYKKGIKNACDPLRKYDNKMEGSWIMQRLVSFYYFEFNTMDETWINDYLQEVFSSLSDQLAGDEKLYKFAGKSGYVWLVPNKPAKVVLWNFQGAIFLKCGLPFLIYTWMYISVLETQRSMKYIDIIKNWGKLILEKDDQIKTMLFLDSYYLTKAAAEWLKSENILYVGVIQKQSLKLFVWLWSPN